MILYWVLKYDIKQVLIRENCGHHLLSTPSCEFFSNTKYVTAENKRSLTPQFFEATMFLKFNERFWDAQLVGYAVDGARSARVEARIKAHELKEESLSSLEEYSQTPLRAYRPWTDFLSLKWGYL